MADVTFPRYETNVIIEGGRAIKVPLVNGVHDLGGMLAAITDKTRMIFVCNPNNPTGTIVGKRELTSFINQVPNHILLVVLHHLLLNVVVFSLYLIDLEVIF